MLREYYSVPTFKQTDLGSISFLEYFLSYSVDVLKNCMMAVVYYCFI